MRYRRRCASTSRAIPSGVDRSVARTPFRNIAEYLGVELSRQNYLPARTVKEAQLLIVVHWGTTIPAVTNQEASGFTNFTGPVQAVPPYETGWKDTVQAHPGSVTRIIVRFEGYAGRYVWHCHVLEHSANEMMRPFEVIAKRPR